MEELKQRADNHLECLLDTSDNPKAFDYGQDVINYIVALEQCLVIITQDRNGVMKINEIHRNRITELEKLLSESKERERAAFEAGALKGIEVGFLEHADWFDASEASECNEYLNYEPIDALNKWKEGQAYSSSIIPTFDDYERSREGVKG